MVLGHYHRGSFLAISVSNVGRALPSLVLIAFFLLVSNNFFWDNTWPRSSSSGSRRS